MKFCLSIRKIKIRTFARKMMELEIIVKQSKPQLE